MPKRCISQWRLIVMTIALCTCALSTATAIPTLTWKNIQVNDKKNAVYAIYTDSKGVLWLGSSAGLHFYDGIRTHAVSPMDKPYAVTAIVEHEGRLYLGSNIGLMTYDVQTAQLSLLYENCRDIRTLLLHNQSLYIGTMEGLYRMDLLTQQLTDISFGLPHHAVYCLLGDKDNAIYVGTYDGLARYDEQQNAYTLIHEGLPAYHSPFFVNALSLCPEQNAIYVGTSHALYLYAPTRKRWQQISIQGGNTIKSLAQLPSAELLVGSDNGFWVYANGKAQRYRHDARTPQSIADNAIWCVHCDTQGNIFAGHGRGFSVASRQSAVQTQSWSDFVQSGEGNEIHVIYRDSKNALWMGGTNGIIRQGKELPEQIMSSVMVRAINEDEKGNIYLATDQGLKRYQPQTRQLRSYSIADHKGHHEAVWLYAIEETQEQLYVGSYLGGVHQIDKSQFAVQGNHLVSNRCLHAHSKAALPNDFVRNILLDELHQRLWMLLYQSDVLTCYDLHTDSSTYYNIAEIAGGSPTHILIDKQGHLWCAYNGGVVIFDHTNAPTVLRYPYTGTDETAIAMAHVKEDIWISTQHNLWRIDQQNNIILLDIPPKGYTAIYYDQLQDKVLLGGTDEWAEVCVNQAHIPHYANTVQLTLPLDEQHIPDLTAFYAGVHDTLPSYTIAHNATLRLMVSTLNYSPTTIQRYMYQLLPIPNNGSESQDNTAEWIIMDENINIIQLSDFKSGSYQLRVMPVGSDMLPRTILLTVNPPMACSWWAIMLYVLCAVGVGGNVLYYRYKKRLSLQQEQQHLQLQQQYQSKLQENSRLQLLTDTKNRKIASLADKQLALIDTIIKDHLSDPTMNVNMLCDKSGLTTKQLYRLVKKNTNMSPLEYIKSIRLQQAASLLTQQRFTVAEVCYMTGFNTPSYFTKCFQMQFGCKPTEYITQHCSSKS